MERLSSSGRASALRASCPPGRTASAPSNTTKTQRGIGGADVALSCVVDDTPEIWASIVPWLASATKLARVHPAKIHVHHVCELRPAIAKLCRTLGVVTHAIDPFCEKNPYTNKIGQCATEFGDVKSVVLTDVDIAFAAQPPFDEVQGFVAGKPVDFPNPPMEVLLDVFSRCGVTPLGVCANAYDDRGVRIEFETCIGNFNGGMYVIPREHLARIGERWAHWARWLIANVVILAHWAKHVDQVAFCLAVSELRMAACILDDRWNYPSHISMGPISAEPYVFHHHALLDEELRLRPVSAPGAQRALKRVNRAIESFKFQHVINKG